MEQIYNKLVRDKIPEIIKGNGEKPITRILYNEEYKIELEKNYMRNIKKFWKQLMLIEIKELADMLETIKYLAKIENSTLSKVFTIAKEKSIKRRTFENKIFLEKVLKK